MTAYVVIYNASGMVVTDRSFIDEILAQNYFDELEGTLTVSEFDSEDTIGYLKLFAEHPEHGMLLRRELFIKESIL